jgi:hypothetical protein
MLASSRLTRLHPDTAVYPNTLSIDVIVLDNGHRELRDLAGLT